MIFFFFSDFYVSYFLHFNKYLKKNNFHLISVNRYSICIVSIEIGK